MRIPLLAGLSLLLSAPLLAATLRVNNFASAQAEHLTIQSAVDAAADGDTLLIEGSSTAYAPFTVLNKRLNLIGPGYELTDNLGTPANKLGAIVQGGTSYIRTSPGSPGSATGTLVAGLEFRSELMLDNCANVLVSRCYINGNYSARLSIGAPGTVVSQCFFGGSSPTNLLSQAADLRIENCLLPNAFFAWSSSSPAVTLRNNLLYGLGGSTSAALTVENNIFINSVSGAFDRATFRNNLFPGNIPTGITGSGNLTYSSQLDLMANINNSASSFDGRYQLQAPSPQLYTAAHYAGTDGTHIGPFGGANPYILSGIPPLPTIDELSAPRFAAPGSSLTIRVKVSQRP
jgi:hypothetical protein